MKGRLKILLVDDGEANLALLSHFVAQMGHTPVTARNGLEAVEAFKASAPDMVLMDVMMPEMDGYEATARIRELNAGRWVPIVFLSALAQDSSLVRGLEAGGDDYLTKPVNLVVLEAKIRAMQRIAALQAQLAEKARELARYHDRAEEENRIASHLMERLINHRGLSDDLLAYWIYPTRHFSGDLVAAARTPANVLYVMLADAVGHGLAAALNASPLVQIFYAMSEKGFPLSSMVEELNRRIRGLMPADRFVAATLASMDARNRVIEVWNGGNPAPLFVDTAGRVLRTWRSSHLPLGILENDQLDPRPEVFQYEQEGQLFMCSDGLLEAARPEGAGFGLERVRDLFARSPPERRFAGLRDALADYLGGQPAHDDVSFILVRAPGNAQQATPAPLPANRGGPAPSRWKLQVRLSASELKYLDAVPLLTAMIEQITGIKPHAGQIFLIASELFNNALEHGLLHLDSGVKSRPAGGFKEYLEQRSRRLQALEKGWIEIGFRHTETEGRPVLGIRVKDSGPGFDFRRYPEADAAENSRPFGRGIALVRSLGADIRYLGSGNEVVVYYPL